jgi:hypothetical protein
MIDKEKLRRVNESKELYHMYVEGEYLYMIRVGDYQGEIEKTKRLHDRGINFAGPISQLKLEDDTVVVEEYFAKGVTMDKMKREYKFSSALPLKEIMSNYSMFFKPYLEEIKLRAEADQSLYNKLFSDIAKMNKENLSVDTCSLGNLFFDKDIGFSIIDAYPYNYIPDLKLLFWLVIGNIPDIVCIENNQAISKCVPEEYYDEFMSYIEMIINKYLNAARSVNKSCDPETLRVKPDMVTLDVIDKLIGMEKDTRIRITL